ncbi:MAG: hypothetical protein ACI9UN_005342 [Granulosicoccus sp.]|jgi:hypothetical protein
MRRILTRDVIANLFLNTGLLSALSLMGSGNTPIDESNREQVIQQVVDLNLLPSIDAW